MAFQYPPSPHTIVPDLPVADCQTRLNKTIGINVDPTVASPFHDMTNEHFPSTPKQATRAVVHFSTPSRPRKSSLSPTVPTSSSVSPLSTFVQTRVPRLSVQGMTKEGEVEAVGRSHPASHTTWKVSAETGGSKSPLSNPKGLVAGPPSGSPSSYLGATQDQYPGRQQFYHPSQHTFHPPSKSQGQGMTLAARRRQSRFDPMAGDEEMDEEGYGELGHRHPLRRVAEEDGKEVESVSLPGIKALFGVAGEHPPTPSTTSAGSLYNSPSLPSLVPNSPSSPSTTRTSRYSSLTSQLSSASETFQGPAAIGGWWAPEFDRGPMSSSNSPRYPMAHRANSYPTVQPFVDEHADKRRRSDGPPSLRDAEESARLRWQAQSRNASYPTASPAHTPTGSGSGGLRSLLHPPPSSSAMSRGAVSSSSGFSSPLTPFHEHPGTPDEYPFERRIAPVPSRSSSIVGGQLAQSFADLSASERADRRSPSMHTDMAPPSLPDRRQSNFHLSQPSDPASPRPNLPPMNLSRPPSRGPLVPRPSSTGPAGQASRRQSLSRPASPDDALRAPVRRSSLTEAIMANSGDRIPGITGFLSGPPSAQSTPLEKPVPLESRLHPPAPLITGWPVRRVSTDSAASTPGISLNSDNEGPASAPVSARGKKRAAEPKQEEDEDMAGDPGMRGMEVLAESASRLQEAEKDHDDSDHSPTRNGSVSSGSGPLQGTVVPGQGGAGPKYACAFCAKTFSRPSSLRIHTYSHTGERPFVCKEPSCRRRFSVQSNLKRHAKVHQLGAQNGGGAPLHQLGPPHPLNGGVSRPIERSHRHSIPPHPVGQGFYHPHHPGQNPHAHPRPHPHHPSQAHGHPGYPYPPPPGYGHEPGYRPPRPQEGRAGAGPQGAGPGFSEEGWEDEEDELEEDELDEENEEQEK